MNFGSILFLAFVLLLLIIWLAVRIGERRARRFQEMANKAGSRRPEKKV